jgi:hypothetical protein
VFAGWFWLAGFAGPVVPVFRQRHTLCVFLAALCGLVLRVLAPV